MAQQITVEELEQWALLPMKAQHEAELRQIKKMWDEERQLFIELLRKRDRTKNLAISVFSGLTTFFVALALFAFYSAEPLIGLSAVGPALASLVAAIGFYRR